MKRLFLYLVKITAYLPLKLLFAVKVSGFKNIPESGGILVLNHSSQMDAALLNACMPLTRICFLASPRLFHCPAICQAFLRLLGAIPAGFNAQDIEALKKQTDGVSRRNLIGFFSQGIISNTSSDFKPGAAIFAMQTGLPLIPVYIHTSLFLYGGSRIIAGAPINVPVQRVTQENAQAITQEVRSKVYELTGKHKNK
ncbi:MAG: 1-acyl-sn-glycerol-3-phosphate acyltransferase [Clostridia bacterium]|nr:1-acyl-sn-glycerol-3-phosphate acyltransferase [Clostridia bacterium]